MKPTWPYFYFFGEELNRARKILDIRPGYLPSLHVSNPLGLRPPLHLHCPYKQSYTEPNRAKQSKAEPNPKRQISFHPAGEKRVEYPATATSLHSRATISIFASSQVSRHFLHYKFLFNPSLQVSF